MMGKEWELPWEPVMELRKGKALGRRSAQRLALLWAEESDEESVAESVLETDGWLTGMAWVRQSGRGSASQMDKVSGQS